MERASTSLDFRQIAYQRQIVNISTRATDCCWRCRKRNYGHANQCQRDAVERTDESTRQVSAADLVFQITSRPSVTSGCPGTFGLSEPDEHTTCPNLACRDNVTHNQTLYTWKRRHRSMLG